jgi:hypothetical protein
VCTTGAKILKPGHEFVLFKNRDFKRAHFDDRLDLTDHAFGVLGLETWDGDNSDLDRFSGYSIGFNQHLACCDSNVRTVEGGDNYDKLVQGVVENCATIDEAITHVRRMAAERSYDWANMIVVTPDGVAALEVRGEKVEVERNPISIARANHHVCLGATPHDDDTITTAFRYQTAQVALKTATGIEDIFVCFVPIIQRTDMASAIMVCMTLYTATWFTGMMRTSRFTCCKVIHARGVNTRKSPYRWDKPII